MNDTDTKNSSRDSKIWKINNRSQRTHTIVQSSYRSIYYCYYCISETAVKMKTTREKRALVCGVHISGMFAYRHKCLYGTPLLLCERMCCNFVWIFFLWKIHMDQNEASTHQAPNLYIHEFILYTQFFLWLDLFFSSQFNCFYFRVNSLLIYRFRSFFYCVFLCVSFDRGQYMTPSAMHKFYSLFRCRTQTLAYNACQSNFSAV